MDCLIRRAGLPGLPLYAFAGMPVEWEFGDRPGDGIGGPPVENAGTIHVAIGTEQDWVWEDGAVFSFTVNDLANDLLDGWGATNRLIDPAHAPAAKRLIAELRRVADALESKLAP